MPPYHFWLSEVISWRWKVVWLNPSTEVWNEIQLSSKSIQTWFNLFLVTFFFSCIIMISADGWIIFCYVGWCESLSRLVGQNNWFLIVDHTNEILSWFVELRTETICNANDLRSYNYYYATWAVEYERPEKCRPEWDWNQIKAQPSRLSIIENEGE